MTSDLLEQGRPVASDGLGELDLGRGIDGAVGPEPSWAPLPAHERGALSASLFRPTSLVVAGATVVGAVVRLLVPRGLWLDEAISVHDARLAYGTMLHTQSLVDVHPPLYFTVLWMSSRVIGFGDLAVRMPSIVLGTVLIPLVYLLGKEAYDRRTGAVAAVLVAFAPLLVWYSQEARMYMLLMVLGVSALWAQLRILRRSGVGLDAAPVERAGWGGLWPWAVYTVCTVSMAWTQYFGLWQVAFQQLVFLGVLLSRWRRGRSVAGLAAAWAVSAVVVVTTLVPLALLARQQFSVHQATGQAFGVAVHGPGGASLGIYSVMTNIAWGLIGYHSNAAMATMVALWPVGMLVALALLGRRARPISGYFVGAVLVPVALMFALGVLKSNLFEIRYMSTVVPVLFLLTARAVATLTTARRTTVVATAALVALLCAGLVDQQTASSNPRRYDFREALAYVDAQARPGDVVLYRPVDLWSVFDVYSPALHPHALTDQPPLPVHGHRVFVVTSPSLMDGSVDNITVTRAVDRLGATGALVADRSWPNVEVRVYR